MLSETYTYIYSSLLVVKSNVNIQLNLNSGNTVNIKYFFIYMLEDKINILNDEQHIDWYLPLILVNFIITLSVPTFRGVISFPLICISFDW